jgi:D-serine deaminase-like pyridoxal phosphate-dependent protein
VKRGMGLLLSTISTAAVTAVLGLPDIAAAKQTLPPAPIERLASIREAYLATLPEACLPQGAAEHGDRLAQFRNFSNWRNR